MNHLSRLFAAASSTILCLAAFAASSKPARLYLSGEDRASAVDWEFRCSAGAKAGVWTTIPVPSNWEMHGFGTLSYGALEPSESGEYRHRFKVPPSFDGQRIFLVFDGVMTDATATLNGQPLGEKHQGGFHRFKYEVTSLIRTDAENLLEVHVDETSADASINRAERLGDYWNFGGIFRPVWLQAVPPQFIERIAVDARADGSVAIHAFVDGNGVGTTMEARVFTLDGKPQGDAFSTPVKEGEIVLRSRIDHPELWTAETPHLYEVEVRLLSESSKVLHRVKERIGFRTFEVRLGQGLFLNGRKIVLQGINRHSFNAMSGRCLGEEDQRTDIALIKGMNINAVRMAHYPPDERFLELCDELGLYVLDELSGWQKTLDTGVGRRLVREMLVRDVNHPSILFWDNGNEGGWNTELDGEFAKWDLQARPVLHPWGILNGINTAHYRVYPHAQLLSRGMTTAPDDKPGEAVKMGEYPLIYMPTEFMHGLFDGGAGAGLDDFWSMMRASPTLGGGFIWVFRDEGVKRPDTGKIDVAGNQAPDGAVGPFGEKEASYFTIKELWSPLLVSGALPSDGTEVTLQVENRYSFTDAASCRFAWRLLRQPGPGDAADAHVEVQAEGRGVFPSIVPGTMGALRLQLPADWKTADTLALRVDDPQGKELWTYTWPLAGLLRFRAVPDVAKPGVPAATATEAEDALQIAAASLLVSFSRKTGMLTEVRKNRNVIAFSNGPRPAVGEAKLVSLVHRRDGPDIVVTAAYEGAMQTVEWRVRPNGWLDCQYSYRPTRGSTYQGVCFDYPENRVRAKTWLGLGPYRVWQNRLAGVTFGLWSNAYNDTVTGWSGWVYPEFKGCFAGVRWLNLDTNEGLVCVIPHSDDLYVQVLKPSVPPEELQMSTKVDLPGAGLAFLDVIPAIGTKFTRPDMMGPHGQPGEPKASYQNKISFGFGP